MENMRKVLSTYIIDERTMIILPKVTPSQLCSIVREEDDEFIVLQTPTEIVAHSCYFYGVNYKGRISSTEALTGVTHKPPIAVSPQDTLFFFPTISSSRYDCIWISHNHVKEVHKVSEKKVRVSFFNHDSFTLDISMRSFKNQLHRTGQLISAYANSKATKAPPRQFELVHENELDEYILNEKESD